jgi:hypothetical protein
MCMPIFMVYFKINYYVIFDYVQPKSLTSISYLSLEMLMRVFQGFCHATLHYHPFLHAIVLGLGYVLFVGILTQSVGCFVSKTVAACVTMRYCMKVVFHLLLIFDNMFLYGDGESSDETLSFGSTLLIVMCVIFGFALL